MGKYPFADRGMQNKATWASGELIGLVLGKRKSGGSVRREAMSGARLSPEGAGARRVGLEVAAIGAGCTSVLLTESGRRMRATAACPGRSPGSARCWLARAA
jgi:hypothetical protein